MKKTLAIALAIFILIAPLTTAFAYYDDCDRAQTYPHDRAASWACIQFMLASIEYGGGDWQDPGDGDDTAGWN